MLNNYCLKQIKAVAMAADEINAAGGLLGRKVEIIFYDTQSSNRLYSQYATQAFVRDKVDVIHGAVASSAREVVRPIVQRFRACISTMHCTKAASATGVMSAPAWCRDRSWIRWSTT